MMRWRAARCSFQLRKLLQAAPALADEVGSMLKEAQQAGVVADNGAAVIQGGIRADRGKRGRGSGHCWLAGSIQTRWQDS